MFLSLLFRDHRKRRGDKDDPDWGDLKHRKFSPLVTFKVFVICVM